MALIQPSAFEMVEPGIYAAVISDGEEQEHAEYGPQLKFTFTLLDENGDPSKERISQWCGRKWNPKSKLYEWAQAVLKKRCPSADVPFDWEDLIDKKCDIKVERVPGANGSERTKVTKLYPFGTMSQDEEED